MKRVVGIYSALILLLLAACGNRTEETVQEPIVTDQSEKYASDKKDDFNAQFNLLLKSLRTKNKAELSKFVSPEFGLLVIRADGAMPSILIARNNEKEFAASLESLFSSVPDSVILINEPLPRVDCGQPSFYTKTGNFVRDTNLLSGSEIWKYGGLAEEDAEFAEKAVQSVGRTVMLAPGVTFLFTYHQNTWYLSLVDLRKPCQA